MLAKLRRVKRASGEAPSLENLVMTSEYNRPTDGRADRPTDRPTDRQDRFWERWRGFTRREGRPKHAALIDHSRLTTEYIFDIGHPCYGQPTAVSTKYKRLVTRYHMVELIRVSLNRPLTSIGFFR